MRYRYTSRPGRLYQFRGKPRTANEIAAILGMTVGGVNYRLRNDSPLDEPRYPQRKLTFRGEMLTIQQIVERTGLSRSQVSKRHDGKRFYEKDELKTSASRPWKERLITFKGETRNLSDWGKRLGISYQTIADRLDILGWPIERALTLPRQQRGGHNRKFYTYNGITDTLTGWANRTGIPHDTLHMRIKNGWPIEQALTQPLRISPQRARYKRNAELIAKMAEVFNHNPPPATWECPQDHTGGRPKTFQGQPGTVAPKQKKQFDHKEGANP